MPPVLSEFARGLGLETAFSVLARARELQAAGKDVVELEIGDSPFPTPATALSSGLHAIRDNHTHYCPSPGLPGMRQAAARMVNAEFGIPARAENIVVGPGAKVFEQFFCEAFLEAGDGVLVFSPYFPTYPPNIARRGARMVTSPLRESRQFRPDPADVARFLDQDHSPRAIFLNSPHNPTGGVATREDLREIADLIRGRDVAVFSDEPYCHMVWQGRHHSLLAEPGMLDHGVAAYTFSKSYSMSGWRLGFCVASEPVSDAIIRMVNSTISCTPPMVQLAGQAALEHDGAERDEAMRTFHRRVLALATGLRKVDGIETLEPTGTFYVYANVQEVCDRFRISSHGLAMYLLEAADDGFGIACLGGECFGEDGQGFLRLSCAEPEERLEQAVAFIPQALARSDRLAAFRDAHPAFAR